MSLLMRAITTPWLTPLNPWIFAVPIALAAVSFGLTVVVVPHSREHVAGGFDVAGSLLSVIAVGGLVLGVHEGPDRGWTDPVTIALMQPHDDHPLADLCNAEDVTLEGVVEQGGVFLIVFETDYGYGLIFVVPNADWLDAELRGSIEQNLYH